jgi:PhnB protein
MSKIVAYIHFNQNNCREAMTFYQECIGGDLSLQVVKDSPMKDMFPPQMQDSILHADLTKGDLTLLGSEIPGEQEGFTVSLMLVTDTKAELLQLFDKLGAGGKVVHGVETFYAGSMGNLIDKFGMHWGLYTAEI